MPHQRCHPILTCIVIAFVVFAAIAKDADADAIIVNKAASASTIAEIYIGESEVRIELEIGESDRQSLHELLSKEFLSGSQLSPEMLGNLFREQLVVKADAGETLSPELVEVRSRPRLVRDEITGDPLPVQPKNGEEVVIVKLRYPFSSRPKTLRITPPYRPGTEYAAANIGFVTYHNGLPVNDFRYLSTEMTLDLDWDDPWYSRFRHPNFRRKFDEPLSAFLYVEPYEVRKEIIVRPKDLQTWLNLELRDDGLIPVDQQEKMKQQVSDFLSEKNPVTIDGRLAEGRLDRIHFIHRTLRTTGIIEPAVDLDATSATLGVIFVYPVDTLPELVSMKWELFNPKLQMIPGVASDEAGGFPVELTPEDPNLEWKNYLTNPTIPRMLTVSPPPDKPQIKIPVVSFFCGGVLIIMLVVFGQRWRTTQEFSRIMIATSMIAFAVGLISLPFAKASIANPFQKQLVLSDQDAEEILSSLLHNVYRSFDHHDDNLIYDRLSKSISGELLSDVYLETRKSMEIKNQGGLRISVKEVGVTELQPVEEGGADPTFHCRWRVSGWIGHWGHIHRRDNEHVARITIADRDGMWKITSLQMLDEQAVKPSQSLESRRQDEGA